MTKKFKTLLKVIENFLSKYKLKLNSKTKMYKNKVEIKILGCYMGYLKYGDCNNLIYNINIHDIN